MTGSTWIAQLVHSVLMENVSNGKENNAYGDP